MPILALMIAVPYTLHYMGYGRVYQNVDDYGWGYLIFSIFWFIVFTDFMIYWAHRFLHVQVCVYFSSFLVFFCGFFFLTTVVLTFFFFFFRKKKKMDLID